MAPSSAIPLAPALAAAFAAAPSPRFIKVSIHNDHLVHDLSIPALASFDRDLALLPDILHDHVPAFVLANLAPSHWLAISYVPESANVRDKMLYASSRASLLKSLGSALFTDSLFATSKADLTPDAYAAHRRHINAPKPLSPREQDMADVRAAEHARAHPASRPSVNHIASGVGFPWSDDLQHAVSRLAQAEHCAIVVMEIDRQSETLILKSTLDATIQSLPTLLPSSQPCYALFAWPHQYTTPPRREIVYIYSCPPTSPIKDRMIYSSGVSTTYNAAKALLADAPPTTHLASRKVETSHPGELDEAYLKAELRFDVGQSVANTSFARPRGPAKKR